MLKMDCLAELIRLRHALHRRPELSFQEENTAGQIVRYLSRYHPDKIIERLGGCGVAAVYRGREDGPTILLRAELDALPIDETNDIAYKSEVKGVSHACGHDGHMAILAGLARLMDENGLARGRVVLLFQPAEENLKGAASVAADPRFREIKPDYAFALHNMTGYPMHQIVVKEGVMLSAVRTVIIRLFGKTAHSSMPENGVSPLNAVTAIAARAAEIQNGDHRADDFSMATVVGLTVGAAPSYGVSPADGKICITLRAYNDDILAQRSREIEAFTRRIADSQHLRIDEISFDEECIATVNNDICNAAIRRAASENRLDVVEMDLPIKSGEDFGEIINACSCGGAMFLIGSGDGGPSIHNPDFDFPDDILTDGLKMFWSIINGDPA